MERLLKAESSGLGFALGAVGPGEQNHWFPSMAYTSGAKQWLRTGFKPTFEPHNYTHFYASVDCFEKTLINESTWCLIGTQEIFSHCSLGFLFLNKSC